ncbi:BarA sensory histidine kinase (= VarS = GacS) [hydrothermal vent metagenome]|uniref:BarA sensory histidine kinase (= VarS = GacS) n=1 Tax=hydrothermal vent metagenome TaxID=652676 RepID=A0A1W1CB40_9ZZZZ
MGGQLDLHSEPGEGTTFFFTIDFEEIETLNESVRGTFSSINALVLESTHKTKRQDTYLREYLDFYGVSYTSFKDLNDLEALQRQVNYDLVIVDYDYADEDSLNHYSSLHQELILLTKSYFMKKIDSMNLEIFKTLYEPLNNSKLRQTLDNIHSENFSAKRAKKINRKKFNAETSRFNANVLIAEDNIINQKLIKRTLEDLGLTITIASNGLEAFQKRKDGNFDLIFMDIQMPFLDGMEATKEILEYEEDYNQPHVPILALTANALKGDRERFIEAGLDEYTTKPLVRSEIISLLNHFLADYIVDTDTNVESTLTKEPETKTQTEIEMPLEIEPEAEIEVPLEIEPEATYQIDILIAKKSVFEAKFFAKILDQMHYTYEIATTVKDIEEKINMNMYNVVLLDKECEGLNLAKFSALLKQNSAKVGLDSKLILITDPSMPEEISDADYADESVKNTLSKDLLRLLIEKFI